jgi:hypothetical protein
VPYIAKIRRHAVIAGGPENAGDLNYALTLVVRSYLKSHGTSYQTINDIVGALEGCKVEFQRRVVAPYEDLKIVENGDVY